MQPRTDHLRIDTGEKMNPGKKPAVPKARRMLLAKAIGFKAARRSSWTAPRVNDLLKQVLAKCPTLADRHSPEPIACVVGQQCAFINRAIDYGEGGVLFEVCAYVKGHVPESIIPDLTKSEAEITAVEIKDDQGKPGELVHTFRCLVLGQVMVMESVRGLGGAAQIVQSLLTNLIRRHTSDKTHPSLVFVDISAPALKQFIESKGGISKITAKIAVDTVESESKYAKVLADARLGVKDAAACAVTWEAAGTLDTDEAIEVLEDSETEALSAVTLHFKYGGSISDLSTYREKHEVFVQQIDGRIAVNELQDEMRDYMDHLRKGGAGDTISEDGSLSRIKSIGAKKK
ncbi:hypothetical protein WH218_12215 [Stenotrophomonas indicatrix]|uniref:hypothetical protein n=1 Tax=Stenotrophomonas indicatrix TaxID=2045451 RepID=UPI0015E02542|nr:hypothetical protein [Stenotrophomonas indicatrix]MBA0099823.1 hypothetical protein [Stenotrophomonas indicatrix]